MSHDLKISANAKKFDIQGGSKLEVFDESGKLIHEGEFKSFTSNFLKLLYGSMVGAGTAKAKDLSGNNIEMDSFPQCTMNMGGGSGNYQFGVVVGTGDSAVGVNEYALVAPATGLNYNDTIIGSPSVGSTSVSIEISRQISNTSGATVALKEAGLICGADGGTTENVLVARDLLNLNLDNGKKSTWRYTINFNFASENGGFVKGLADNFAKLFTEITASPEWVGRNSFGCVVYDGKMWVIGGYTGSSRLNDVWYSTNGVNWTQATSSAPWEKRNGFGCIIYDGKMWVMGGFNSSIGLNDVWYSTDGINWTQATSSAPWTGRYFLNCVVYDDKMWILGGNTSSGNMNDVWYSTNGVNWIQATSSAPWEKRNGFGCIIYDGKMWVVGGASSSGHLNDVWYSTDGINWTQATSSAPWAIRHSFGCIVYGGKMWVVGGFNGSGIGLNDVWYSTNGVNWTQATSSAPWTGRSYFGCVVYDDKMWVIGGHTGSARLNDVWYSRLLSSIMVGSSDSAFSATATALGSLIADGTGTGQLVYGDMPDASTIEPYVEGNKTKFSLAREFTNSSGADITIREVGLFSDSTMLARLILANPITLANGESEIITIDFETEV